MLFEDRSNVSIVELLPSAGAKESKPKNKLNAAYILHWVKFYEDKEFLGSLLYQYPLQNIPKILF